MRTGKIKNNLLKFLICFYFIGCIPQAEADIAIIVNPANANIRMSISLLRDIFLGINARVSPGSYVVPYDLSENSITRQIFYEVIAEKSPIEMKRYWARMIFTGKGEIPLELANDAAVKEIVASDPYAIGYVDASSVYGATGISVIFIIPTIEIN